MKFTIKSLLLGVLLIALVIGGYLWWHPAAIEVELATAKLGPLRVSVQEDGKTRIREKYTVSTPVAGRVSRIELNPGDYCTEQTLLAVILPSNPTMLDARSRAEARARVQAAESALQRAKSSQQQAQINFELSQSKFARVQSLLPSQAIAASDFDIAQAELSASRQAIQTAQFEEEIAMYELEMAQAGVRQFAAEDSDSAAEPFEIFSPIQGRVLRVLQESSAVVSAGTPLIELGDPSNLEIEVDVLSSDAVRIKPGSELTIEHWGGGSPLKGYVRVIEPAAFTKVSSLGVEEQRVNIIADFDEPPDRLQSLGDGYRVEASITVEQLNQALQIPNSALFRYQRQWHVLTVVEDRAHLQPVTLGVQSDTDSQIVSGLQPGDAVIVYPSDAIKPDTPVRAAPATIP